MILKNMISLYSLLYLFYIYFFVKKNMISLYSLLYLFYIYFFVTLLWFLYIHFNLWFLYFHLVTAPRFSVLNRGQGDYHIDLYYISHRNYLCAPWGYYMKMFFIISEDLLYSSYKFGRFLCCANELLHGRCS